jgi:hypothetical protein
LKAGGRRQIARCGQSRNVLGFWRDDRHGGRLSAL